MYIYAVHCMYTIFDIWFKYNFVDFLIYSKYFSALYTV